MGVCVYVVSWPSRMARACWSRSVKARRTSPMHSGSRWRKICARRARPRFSPHSHRYSAQHGEAAVQQSLAGRTIVVTRPEGQAEALSCEIEQRGGRALRFPVLAIAPLQDDAGLVSVAARLDDFALAFFVSPNAVEHALSCILGRRGWPECLPVATVGPGSARALHEAGFEHVIFPRAGFDSEAVLDLPEFSTERLAGRSVVIFRGDGGRE